MDKTDDKLVDHILDALECAKEALSLLPILPPDMKPVYFRILNTIHKLGGDSASLRISDISNASGLLLPNTTKFVNEMVDLNIVRKVTSDSDKRVVLVQATELGEQYIQRYVLSFTKDLDKEIAKINEVDCMIMIDTLHKVCQAMRTVYQEQQAGQYEITRH